jgi:2,3-bisphosphoglycerate-independent phosphoglycerate mutase
LVIMSFTPRQRPVVLCILDGWGQRTDPTDNAIAQARTPVWDRLMATCPHGLLETSGGAVGLPDGQMGNSEVGHMNLGAGRVATPELPRIDKAVADGSLGRIPALTEAFGRIKAAGGACHVIGLLSDGGVHSHQDHMVALARFAAAAGLEVRVHAILDGRDTAPSAGRALVAKFLADIADVPGATIATVSGRFYAMDRDQRWERVEAAYDAIVDGQSEPRAPDALAAIDAAYGRGETDEFVKPVAIAGYAGFAAGDGVVMANFRADRARQMAHALADPAFAGFARKRFVAPSAAISMTSYSAALGRFFTPLFLPERYDDVLGAVLAKAGLKQLRIAETEKYAHVTFFFSGGEETPFPGEARVLVPSPKVATYDLKPEMSAPEVTDKLVEAIDAGTYDVIIVNYANTDMVGHTGKLDAAIRAIEAVDGCLGRLEGAVARAGGCLLITADHGNAEEMRDPATGEAHTQHTLNPVPIVLVNGPAGVAGLSKGRLADVAPTLLALIGLAQPPAMTGHSLLALGDARAGRRAVGD